ncbi:uncharacterized protein RCC_00701 [Ramularia collo-cygni]|uniref:Regulatory P domain-containing protein n=1 Tax=Ramularia collo-cygni TaxID=112498 RepID=A0A2D3UN87_9PEZI|nr:uncharacterized protein RCC_00701 [Ramularia collo-cygni]CZT14738.1 uncharacterized protein RCC_00701 [Ramularia collo-cygni]
MKFSAITLLPALASAAYFAEEEYRSGAVMQSMMERKEASWASQRAAGKFISKKWSGFLPKKVSCKNGLAVAKKGDPLQTFKCNGIDMYDFKSHEELGSPTGEGSGSWGWQYGGREFIALGQSDGTAFAEVTKLGKLVYLGRLPQQSTPVIWREIKVNGNYLVVGSEAVDHGIQIFDMRKLLTVSPLRPKTFSTTTDLTGLFTDLPVGRSHNVVVNEELGYAVAVGAAPRNSSCAGGLIFIDMNDPTKPTSPGCAPQDGYVHDAQCLVYRGPDKKYYGRDICYGYNEDTLTIYDVTNKTGPQAAKIISRTPYVGATYTHQGWVNNPQWQTRLIMDDEIDEEEMAGPAADQFPVSYIWDIESLENPINTGFYKTSVRGIDHNQYIYDGLAYQSNYGAGLRILDVSSLDEDPTGKSVEEVAFFDIYPEDDNLPGGGIVDYVGTWSHYTFPSGWIVVNTIERGAFLVRMSKFKLRGFGKRHVNRA